MKVFNTCIYCLPDYGQRVYMGSLALRAHCMQNSKFSETVTKSVRLSWVSISTTVHSRFYHRIWLDWKPVINLWGIIAQFYGPLFCLCLRQSVRADQIRCLQSSYLLPTIEDPLCPPAQRLHNILHMHHIIYNKSRASDAQTQSHNQLQRPCINHVCTDRSRDVILVHNAL